ncbi:MAG: tRNA (adenosine(37)-N6)-dimethylallyltransferase MiaA [Syntrophales bacterium]|nr:tRNA (adenosine(37)-N6)-dimethylallyltransferase MiaA [Syntrophales bacterium]
MHKKTPCNLVVILGPTASGKTSLAVRLARHLASASGNPGEIISADSRQVYRGMDIGTGKDLRQFTEGGENIRCHLIDIVDPDYEFNLFEFQKAFFSAFTDITGRGNLPILVGGTGLYIEAVTEGYDLPVALDRNGAERINELVELDMDSLRHRFFELRSTPHNTTDILDKRRLARAILIEEKRKAEHVSVMDLKPVLMPLVAGIRVERSFLRNLIRKRLLERIEEGMIDEVLRLRESGLSWERLDSFGLEYRYISRYLKGELTRDEMVDTLSVRIGQFAKRQETWFRRMDRKGTEINWIDYGDFEALRVIVERKIKI